MPNLFSASGIKWLALIGAVIPTIKHKVNNEIYCGRRNLQPKPTGKPWERNWDGLEYSDQNVNDRCYKTIFLIPNGQSNETGGLTQLGKLQAKLTADKLRSKGLRFDDTIWTSNQQRSVETAEIIANNLGQPKCIRQEKVLDDGLAVEPDPPLLQWRATEHGNHAPELYHDGRRLEFAFRLIFHRAEGEFSNDRSKNRIIVVCHPNVIRYFICRALQLSPEGWMRFTLRNCSITSIIVAPDGYVWIKTLGVCGHFPPNVITAY